MPKPVLGRSLGKLLSGDPIAGKFGVPRSGGTGRGEPARAGIPNTGNGLRQLINQPAAPAEQKRILPRWYLLLADGLLLLAAEGIVVKSEGFGWPQGLLCAALVLTGVVLAIIGIVEGKT